MYEDNHLIAVVKPAGILSQGDRTGDKSLFDEVKKYLKEKYKKPADVFLGLVHRLDRPVSGIILFAKTSKGAARLSEQFRNHTVQKTYHAIVIGKPARERGEIKEEIKKISFFAQGFSKKSDREILDEIKKSTKTRTAELVYQVLKSNGKYSLLKITPKTGRFHQIRIQMGEMGNPILGDRKYAGGLASRMVEWKEKNSIALSATGLLFKSATGDKIINLKIGFPESWGKFING